MVPVTSPSDYLIDTNVVSEWTKGQPDPGVMRWLHEVDEDRLFLSAASLAELRHGVERLAAGARRARLAAWLDTDLPERFTGRVLVIDAPTAHEWGRLMARAQGMGRSLGAMDAWFAATAVHLQLTLVTRNVRDFDYLGLPLLNPWQDAQP